MREIFSITISSKTNFIILKLKALINDCGKR